jgi:two-component system NarL family response regulator
MKIKTVVIDEQPVVLEGIKAVLERQLDPQFDIMTFGFSEPSLILLLRTIHPELMIIDLGRDEKRHIGLLTEVRCILPQIKILLYSDFFNISRVQELLKQGLHGCILKSDPVTQLPIAAKRVLSQDVFLSESLLGGNARQDHALNLIGKTNKEVLTKRELQILQLISQAFSNKQIAKNLFISVQTVGVHRKNIMKKLGVSNTAGLVKVAYEHALV